MRLPQYLLQMRSPNCFLHGSSDTVMESSRFLSKFLTSSLRIPSWFFLNVLVGVFPKMSFPLSPPPPDANPHYRFSERLLRTRHRLDVVPRMFSPICIPSNISSQLLPPPPLDVSPQKIYPRHIIPSFPNQIFFVGCVVIQVESQMFYYPLILIPMHDFKGRAVAPRMS